MGGGFVPMVKMMILVGLPLSQRGGGLFHRGCGDG